MERVEIEDVSNLLVRQNVGREWDRVCSMGKDTPSKRTLPYTVRELLEGKGTLTYFSFFSIEHSFFAICSE